MNRRAFPTAPAAPPRLVHLGLGAFHRAHQLWYTQHAEADPRHPEWGYVSFTGRSATVAEQLAEQDGLYTLVERGPEGDEYEVVGALVEARAADDVDRLWELLAAPGTAVVTLTMTESAYQMGPELAFDAERPAVAADLAALQRAYRNGAFELSAVGMPTTPAAKLVVGFAERRRAGAGPLAVVSCDNLSANDVAARHAVQGLAAAVDPRLGEWIERTISFVATSVDRITPRAGDDVAEDVARRTGWVDRSPVVTEPFHSWVLSGDFPAGRPDWERAGAVFVEDIEPFENRKLWLLNGAHSLMAYTGPSRGHTTVAEALADPACRGWVEAFWDEASAHLTTPGLDLPAYRAALLERFANPRIAHHLAQIGVDGATKLQMRAVPVLRAERAAGRPGTAAARMIAAWTMHLEGRTRVDDSAAEQVLAANGGTGRDRVRALLGVLDPELAAHDSVVDLVTGLADRIADDTH
ncbi:mannitol dehydrogenase family protein [Kocuria sp. CPCC 205300]|uniref:mannitol dehydrogenase family protein n=1 Tax=Kocuria sabuli TaxID=3071448 RepID=UPI0036DDB47B